MITGHTRIIGHVGYPTESFKAPMIYNPFFAARGIDCVVVPMGCTAEAYPAFLPALFSLTNIAGALITMPHKVVTLDLVDTLSTTAQVAGACNAVKRLADGRLAGDMFDGEGFARGLERKNRPIAGASILITGNGGVGSAIAAALARRGPALLRLHDLDIAMSDRLAARIRAHYPAIRLETGRNDPSGCDIVVNATPLGMKAGDPLPMDVTRIEPGAMVGEVVMKTEMTPLLEAARARGCPIQVGIDMLFEQIPAYLDFFGFPSATAEELRALATITY
ncbi:shikimate dehydrogenase [Rhabdaerophilum sp. SD176]|uniref:shikimate dehydrogenase family protein n=1 Tax=Rhabdaerophilum sp. SD176 TaxID=2983548 RepID=UPI0024DFBF0D|nr:shikimate dehydrogenase [Rhabdaerophilum sp. SD176]